MKNEEEIYRTAYEAKHPIITLLVSLCTFDRLAVVCATAFLISLPFGCSRTCNSCREYQESQSKIEAAEPCVDSFVMTRYESPTIKCHHGAIMSVESIITDHGDHVNLVKCTCPKHLE